MNKQIETMFGTHKILWRVIFFVACVVGWLVLSGNLADFLVKAMTQQNQAFDAITGGVTGTPGTHFTQIAVDSLWYVWIVARGVCTVPFGIFYGLFFIVTGWMMPSARYEKNSQ
jgi:hypothetical protein